MEAAAKALQDYADSMKAQLPDLNDKLADAKHAINEGIAPHHSQGPIDMAVLRARIASQLGNPIIESADMYKTSHKDMYTAKRTVLQAYGEARLGSELNNIVPFGMRGERAGLLHGAERRVLSARGEEARST